MFLTVSCPFFCVYSLKEFSIVSNLILSFWTLVRNFQYFSYSKPSVFYSKSRNRYYNSRLSVLDPVLFFNLGCFFFFTAYWVVLTNLQFSIQHLKSRSVVIFFNFIV